LHSCRLVPGREIVLVRWLSWNSCNPVIYLKHFSLF
jgi:hypothetical protein